MKDTYFSDFIGELTKIELDSNTVEQSPGISYFKETLRASKYSPFADPSYESMMRTLAHKTLGELSLLNEEQRINCISLLEQHENNIREACDVWRKYYDKPQNSWGGDKLVGELCARFAINTNHIIWLVEADPTRDKTGLLEDLQYGLTRKYQITVWLIQQLKLFSVEVKTARIIVDNRENRFNKPMPLSEARRWFIQLAENNSKNGKPFLTVEQVDQFIERAFVGNENVPKLTFNRVNGEKLALWKIFYQFYNHCVDIENGVERSVQCRDKYIRLLTDNFTNFTFSEVRENFSKSNQTKKDWNLPY